MTPGVYLGDGVYASFDGFHIILKTERGIGKWDVIYLDPSVMNALTQYAEIISSEPTRAEGRS